MNLARNVLILIAFVGFAATAPAGELITRNGRYIDLTTDLENANQITTLVASFDAAAEQWLDFWQADEAAADDWRVTAHVMADDEPFRRNRLIPDTVPDFPFGYTLDDQLWVRVQPSEYYTRHLLLHEGVHALAFHLFGGAGPMWYMEGTAEMLATHTGVGTEIEINQIPDSRDQVPYWGRFKRIDQLRRKGHVPTIEMVMQYQPKLFNNVTPYSWSWAAAMLFYHYPEYRAAFDSAARRGSDRASLFNRRFYQSLRYHWPVARARWRMLCHELDYGFDWTAERIELSVDEPLWDGQAVEVNVAADRGWQSIGMRLPPGANLQLTPQGEAVLGTDPKPWVSLSPGVTIRYHKGRPLGQLIACLLPCATPAQGFLPPLEVFPVAEKHGLQIESHCWLMLRVNDAPAELSDNRGAYRVTISN